MFAGVMGGAMVGAIGGALVADFSLGLDGALLGGISVGLAGCVVGLVLGIRDNSKSRSIGIEGAGPPGLPCVDPSSVATGSFAPMEHNTPNPVSPGGVS
jgi:hypothetical protein